MTNNVFRKGLVAAAIVALGSTGLAAAPAQAASVLFAPTTGTGNTLVAGDTFSLTASLSSDLPASNSTQLKFKVTNTTGVAATVKLNNTTILADGAVIGSGANEVAYATTGHTAPSALAADTASAVYGLGTANADASVVPAAASASAATNPTSIQITTAAATTSNFTVVAFLDANNNGTVDAGEISASQDVHFVKIADSGIKVNFTAPTQAAGTVNATLSFAADVNVAQLTATKYGVAFTQYVTAGKTNATTAQTGTGAVVGDLKTVTDHAFGNDAYSSTKNALAFASAFDGKYYDTAARTGIVAGATYSAQAFYANSGAHAAVDATEVLATAAATQADAITQLAPALSDNVKGSNAAYTVRTGTTSVSLSATVKNTPAGGTQAAVGSGVVVNYSVASPTFGLAADGVTKDTLSVNGVAITSASTFPVTGTVTTDANGKITIPVVTGNGYAGTVVAVTVTVPNGASLTNTQTLTWGGSTTQTVVDNSLTGVHTVVKGGSLSASYSLVDAFGALVKNGSYQLVATEAAAGAPSPATVTVYVPFVNGVATLALADNSTTTGTNTVTLALQKQINGLWTGVSAGALDGQTITAPANTQFTVLAAAPVANAVSATVVNTVATTTNSATAKAALDVTDSVYVSGDKRTAGAAFTVPTPTSAGVVTISGTVTDVNGNGIPGATVTLTSANLQFGTASAFDSGLFGKGAITVTTGSTGTYTVYAASHSAGTQSVVVASGAATKTVSVYVTAAGPATGKTITITAPATAVPGQTINFSALVADKFGNPVAVAAGDAPAAVSVKATGVGSATNAATADATGTAAGFVTTGAGDAGTITVTATYTTDGTSANTVTATATIKVAAAAAAKTALAVGSDQAQVGAAVDVIATATDAAGKPAAGVVVTFDNVGQGYLSATTATTDANGVAKVKLVGNVAGRNTLTATAKGATAANAGVSFGAADANITVKGKRATVTYEFAGLAKVVVSVNGTRQPAVYPADDNEGTYSFNLKAGTNKIVVSIAGKTVDSKTVKIKK